uniref:DUF7027 domain-containing protein n=1 Tax=Phlebotomus papatasi TaxID=29031 RepID=A0A1B0CYF1_PHLPP
MDIFLTVGKYIMMPIRLIFSPRYVRIAALMISIYQVILSHAVLFSIVLGLLHAERVNKVLEEDIAEENEMAENTELPDNAETVNQIRFKSAQELSSITCLGMVALTTMAAIYLLSCLALLIGTLKNRPKLMIPWLVLDGISALIMILFMTTVDMNNYAQKMGGIANYSKS